MSVPKSMRGDASTLFLYKAREQKIFSIRQCAKLPKRYMFLITQDMMNCMNAAYRAILDANAIWPTNTQEAQTRRNLFLRAEGEQKALSSNIAIADEIIGMDKENMRKWSDLINHELRLIGGVMQSDKERWKNFDP